ncbi:hypothetical protein J6TS7_33270 [Paenibacillus dendritiformis]|nr:hypothetical protein J6TS7_33270 [Paenibacillus dendritiformis]
MTAAAARPMYKMTLRFILRISAAVMKRVAIAEAANTLVTKLTVTSPAWN